MPELFFPNGTTWSASTVTFNVLSFSSSWSPGLDAFLQYVRTWDGKYNSVETVAQRRSQVSLVGGADRIPGGADRIPGGADRIPGGGNKPQYLHL